MSGLQSDKKLRLNEDRDAARWAREFIEGHKGQVVGTGRVDEGILIAWFANAIMCGEDTYRWRQEATAQSATGDTELRLRNQVEAARQVINRGVDIMETHQVGQWKGVRSWLEQGENDYEPFAPSATAPQWIIDDDAEFSDPLEEGQEHVAWVGDQPTIFLRRGGHTWAYVVPQLVAPDRTTKP